MVTQVKHYINGKQVSGRNGRTSSVFNPATGEQTGLVPIANASGCRGCGRCGNKGCAGLGGDDALAASQDTQPLPPDSRGPYRRTR